MIAYGAEWRDAFSRALMMDANVSNRVLWRPLLQPSPVPRDILCSDGSGVLPLRGFSLEHELPFIFRCPDIKKKKKRQQFCGAGRRAGSQDSSLVFGVIRGIFSFPAVVAAGGRLSSTSTRRERKADTQLQALISFHDFDFSFWSLKMWL